MATDTKAKPVEQAQADEPDALAMVLKDFKASWDYTSSSWFKRWQDNYKLYNNQRVNVGYVGISNVFIPITCSTVDALTSGLYGVKPKFDYIPPKDSDDGATDILNAQLDEWWDEDQWSLKVPETGKFKFMLGTAIDYFSWDIDHPVLIHVPIRDFFIDPTAAVLDERVTRFCGRRYLTTVDDLKTYEIVDPATGKMGPKYTELDQVTRYKNPEYTDKEQKDMWYGSTVGEPEEGQVECIEWWSTDRVITVANRCVVIEDTENYFKAKAKKLGDKNPRGILPFADDRDITDLSLFYAKSTVDMIAGQQEQLNDLSNQLADALTYTINQQYTISTKFAHLQGQVKNLPGATYVADKDAINPIVRGTIPPDAFLQIQNIKNEMRETTGVNEIVKGVPTEGGKATATEINAQVAGAGQRISLKVTQLENGYFYRMGKIMFAFMRLYITDKKQVRVSGKDGTEYQDFDPKLFKNGEYKPRIQLDITVENKKKDEAAQAKEMLAAFLNDPEVNQQWLKKKVLATGFNLDPDEVAEAFEPNPLAAVPPMPMDGGMGMPPMDPMAGGMMPPMGGDMGMAPPPMDMGAPMPPEQPPMPVEDLLAMIPPEVLAQLPADVTPEELALIVQAVLDEQQAQPVV
jgi:hypothetical protein